MQGLNHQFIQKHKLVVESKFNYTSPTVYNLLIVCNLLSGLWIGNTNILKIQICVICLKLLSHFISI